LLGATIVHDINILISSEFFWPQNFFDTRTFFNASSVIPFKVNVLFPQYATEVITILHYQSLARAATAVDENPAKGTECIAPILAQS
jgi:hypothetical protein